MIIFQKWYCPKCKKHKELLPTNNPLWVDICSDCLYENLDISNLEHADFFCRYYNLPFKPEIWINLAANPQNDVLKLYVMMFLEEEKESLYWGSGTKDQWKILNDEFEKMRDFDLYWTEIAPLKDWFIRRSQVKWGSNYTFDEYIKMESILTKTIAATGLEDSFKIDALQKACKIGTQIERAIELGDSKAIKELSDSYSKFVKAADLETIIGSLDSDNIYTVADLVAALEELGYQMDYSVKEEKDIVDKTINDIKKYISTLVTESIGLDVKLKETKEAKERAQYEIEAQAAKLDYSVSDMLDDVEDDYENEEFDRQLAERDIDE